jgi:hypothetical protein
MRVQVLRRQFFLLLDERQIIAKENFSLGED